MFSSCAVSCTSRVVRFPHHIFDGADELVVEEQMLRLVLGVGSRVEHPARAARHRPEVLLPGVLRGKSNDRGDRRQGLDSTLLTRRKCRYNDGLGCVFVGLFEFPNPLLQAGFRRRSADVLRLCCPAVRQAHVASAWNSAQMFNTRHLELKINVSL